MIFPVLRRSASRSAWHSLVGQLMTEVERRIAQGLRQQAEQRCVLKMEHRAGGRASIQCIVRTETVAQRTRSHAEISLVFVWFYRLHGERKTAHETHGHNSVIS